MLQFEGLVRWEAVIALRAWYSELGGCVVPVVKDFGGVLPGGVEVVVVSINFDVFLFSGFFCGESMRFPSLSTLSNTSLDVRINQNYEPISDSTVS